MLEIRFVNRGYKENLVLVPGWATDYRIFSCLDLPYNYLLPSSYSPFGFAQGLRQGLEKNGLAVVSILGWSMGGFLALDFCNANCGMVKELFLLGIRKKYPHATLREINLKLVKNKNAWLYKFYQDLFAVKEAEGFSWFKKKLLKEYLGAMGLEDLIAGLEYLSRAEVRHEHFVKIDKLRIFHGAHDAVAPLVEAEELSFYHARAEFIRLEDSGHALFFNPDFRENFSHG